MLTLDASLHIPESISFSVVGQDAFLLNTKTNQYFALEEVGARLWELLKDGSQLRESYQTLLNEYEVASDQLEQDVLELIGTLLENGLVELDQT
jgi:hypothetical protein